MTQSRTPEETRENAQRNYDALMAKIPVEVHRREERLVAELRALNAKPVAKLVPPDEPKKDVFGCMANKIKIIGDIESPVLPPIEEWDLYRLPWAANFGAPRRRKGKGRRPRKAKR